MVLFFTAEREYVCIYIYRRCSSPFWRFLRHIIRLHHIWAFHSSPNHLQLCRLTCLLGIGYSPPGPNSMAKCSLARRECRLRQSLGGLFPIKCLAFSGQKLQANPCYPRSMYGIFTCMFFHVYGINLGKYTIHWLWFTCSVVGKKWKIFPKWWWKIVIYYGRK